jgi:hypothetical protein
MSEAPTTSELQALACGPAGSQATAQTISRVTGEYSCNEAELGAAGNGHPRSAARQTSRPSRAAARGIFRAVRHRPSLQSRHAGQSVRLWSSAAWWWCAQFWRDAVGDVWALARLRAHPSRGAARRRAAIAAPVGAPSAVRLGGWSRRRRVGGVK